MVITKYTCSGCKETYAEHARALKCSDGHDMLSSALGNIEKGGTMFVKLYGKFYAYRKYKMGMIISKIGKNGGLEWEPVAGFGMGFRENAEIVTQKDFAADYKQFCASRIEELNKDLNEIKENAKNMMKVLS